MMQVHKSRDIYLAAYCKMQGCSIAVENDIGQQRAVFVIALDSAPVKLKALIDDYYSDKVTCNPKTLKYVITDLKNQLFSVADNESPKNG